jgi:hypothetical protein
MIKLGYKGRNYISTFIPEEFYFLELDICVLIFSEELFI